MRTIDTNYAPEEELIHGTQVRDPYRWLEDRHLPETAAWIAEQQRRCQGYFAMIGELDTVRERVRNYLDVEVVDQPARVGDKYFFRRRRRGEEQGSIFVCDGGGDEGRLLIDPSSLGSYASVSIYRIASNGSLLAFELKHCGSSLKEIQIVDVTAGTILQDSLGLGSARGLSFTSDLTGFYYCHDEADSSADHSIRLHLFGTADDHTCFKFARSSGSRLILIADQVHLAAVCLHQRDSTPVIDFWIARRERPENWSCVFINRTLPLIPTLRNGRIYALTYAQAPNGRIVELDQDGKELQTVVPESDAMIRELSIANRGICINQLHQMTHSIQYWSFDGTNLGRASIPVNGTVHLLAQPTEDSDSFFYTFQSFTHSPTIFECDAEGGGLEPRHRLSNRLRSVETRVRRVTYPASDGTGIPMTLFLPEQSSPMDSTPILMTAYGGFCVSMTPQFSVLVSIMVELGCVLAIPHIRGGGEFGAAWHESGRGRNRQVAFDDFLAAAKWLRNRESATPQPLAIFGGSNAGLLVGAAMTQRPDLFDAVLCIAPLLDMVRYELFDHAVKWREEYGTVQNAEDFEALHAYSPYHRIEVEIDYPPVLFVSGDQDDRCNPAHVRKMAARLQERDAQSSSVIVDYSAERGHSPVLPLSVRVEALARRIAFLCRELNIPASFGGGREATLS